MDIGGGSTEFILIEDGKLSRKESFDIGVSRIIQKFELRDPLSDNDIDKIINFLESNTDSFFKRNKSLHLIGASGSFETYSDLIKKKTIDPWKSSLLPFSELLDQLDYLIGSSSINRKENKMIPGYREPMIHVAALKTRWVIEQLGIEQCYMSPASLKEGVIIREFGK
jgi:exopolyphosphatase/guanosine-5'-triphosphate,3'-diphosphate pyrophosphatase